MSVLIRREVLGFLGNVWSPWGPGHKRGLHINQGLRRITSDIITVCLVKKGERYLHPDYGLRPELFDPLSNYPLEYWTYVFQEEIIRWVSDIETLSVTTLPETNYLNEIAIQISFVPRIAPSPNTLTFGFYSYQGLIWDNSYGEQFLNTLYLNDQPFRGMELSNAN